MGSRKHNSNNKIMVRTVLERACVSRKALHILQSGRNLQRVYIALVPYSPHVDLIRRPP